MAKSINVPALMGFDQPPLTMEQAADDWEDFTQQDANTVLANSSEGFPLDAGEPNSKLLPEFSRGVANLVGAIAARKAEPFTDELTERVKTLREPMKTVVVSRHFMFWTEPEIAAGLGISENTVRFLLDVAHDQLADVVDVVPTTEQQPKPAFDVDRFVDAYEADDSSVMEDYSESGLIQDHPEAVIEVFTKLATHENVYVRYGASGHWQALIEHDHLTGSDEGLTIFKLMLNDEDGETVNCAMDTLDELMSEATEADSVERLIRLGPFAKAVAEKRKELEES